VTKDIQQRVCQGATRDSVSGGLFTFLWVKEAAKDSWLRIRSTASEDQDLSNLHQFSWIQDKMLGRKQKTGVLTKIIFPGFTFTNSVHHGSPTTRM
jgi:hypothetical protein